MSSRGFLYPISGRVLTVLTHAHSDSARTTSRVDHAAQASQRILEHCLGTENSFITLRSRIPGALAPGGIEFELSPTIGD